MWVWGDAKNYRSLDRYVCFCVSAYAENIRTVVDDLFGVKKEKPVVAAVKSRYCYQTIRKVNYYT
jgi:hypothetical protein